MGDPARRCPGEVGQHADMAILRAAAAILLVRDVARWSTDRWGAPMYGAPGTTAAKIGRILASTAGSFRSAGVAELCRAAHHLPVGRGSPNIRAQVPEKQRSIPDDNGPVVM